MNIHTYTNIYLQSCTHLLERKYILKHTCTQTYKCIDIDTYMHICRYRPKYTNNFIYIYIFLHASYSYP